jgi:16S rRNA (uracil1498-N3)-methyltransferase
LQRYFIESLNETGFIEISGNDFFHIVKVMRSSVGSKFYCVVNGKTSIAEITEVLEQKLVAKPIEWITENTELPVEVTVVCGLPKGDKLDLIVQKGTELGAHYFVPFAAKRSVVKWDDKKSDKKVERLNKIAKEAAEQSHRTIIPTVLDVKNVKGLIEHSKNFDVKLIAYEESARQGEQSTLAASLKSCKAGQKIILIFGPEGGLDSQEMDQLVASGFISCGLGPRILRAETAPLYALSAISYALELNNF